MNIQKYQAMLDKIKSPFDPQTEYRNYYQRVINILNSYKRDIQNHSAWSHADFCDRLNREKDYGYIFDYKTDATAKKLSICWLNKEWTEFNLP